VRALIFFKQTAGCGCVSKELAAQAELTYAASVLVDREQVEKAQLLDDICRKCQAAEESEEWIVGAKAEKCKVVLALLRRLAQDAQRQLAQDTQ